MPVRSIVALLLAAVCCGVTALATAPAKVDDVATVEDIVGEIDDKVKVLTRFLETPEKFEAAKGKDVRQGFGVISVMGQSLVEHSQNAQAGFDGAAIRDAALRPTKKPRLRSQPSQPHATGKEKATRTFPGTN